MIDLTEPHIKVIVKARVRSLAEWKKYLSSDAMIAAENENVQPVEDAEMPGGYVDYTWILEASGEIIQGPERVPMNPIFEAAMTALKHFRWPDNSKSSAPRT